MATVYLDSSAAAKLIVCEPESESLRDFLRDFAERTSSDLLEVELQRLLLRHANEHLLRSQARELLRRMALLPIDASIRTVAASLQPPTLRSLDAIPVATALSVTGLAGLVAYDLRLCEAARAVGLMVWAPGTGA